MYVSMYVCTYFFSLRLELLPTWLRMDDDFVGETNWVSELTRLHISLSLSWFWSGFLVSAFAFFCVCFLLRFLVLDSVRHYVEQVARDYWFSAKRVAPYVANATATLLQLASTMQPRWNWTNLFRSYLTVSFIYLVPNSYGPSLWAYLGQVDQNKWAEFHFNWDWVEFGPNSNQPWFCC